MTVSFEWLGEQAKAAARRGASRGLLKAAEEIKEASLEVVPRRTDLLAASAGTSVSDGGLVASVYYDDPRDIKTIKQHEDLSYHHPAGESAKFLEKPFKAARGTAAALAAEIARELT